jgi:aryl-alcohol dehydrogenase-like predicted oxidoreductase
LRRLDVDTVDLYQVHAWDPLTPIEETLSFLADSINAGKIRYYGLSNFTGWQVQYTCDTARNLGLPKPVTLQPQYNLLSREVEWEIVPACLHNGLGLLCWSPLASGILTGKYQRNTEPAAGHRLAHDQDARLFGGRLGDQRTWNVLDAVTTVANRHGATASQVALAWVAAQPSVSSIILGARTTAQLEDNLRSVKLALSETDARLLDTASEPPVDYPYGGMALRQRSRNVEGGWHHDRASTGGRPGASQ